MTKDEFIHFQKQYEEEPVIFFFEVDAVNDRNELDNYNRQGLIEKCCYAFPLSEFDTDWNDTVDHYAFVPNPTNTWCKVSIPE